MLLNRNSDNHFDATTVWLSALRVVITVARICDPGRVVTMVVRIAGSAVG